MDKICIFCFCLHSRFTMLPGGILQIDNVTQEDAGEYKCRATNLLRSRNSRTAILNVLPPFQGPLPQVPRIVAPPQNLIKKVGEYAVFECLANHPEYEVSWSRQGEDWLLSLNRGVCLIKFSNPSVFKFGYGQMERVFHPETLRLGKLL